MAATNKKTVIGLTGNIATGKTVVRKMLEHLGAYTIDADALTRRALAKGGPAYQPVLDLFGKFILTEDGQIDRDKLAKVVFSDSEALKSLESIVHPVVRQAVDYLINRASQDVVVVEAIKLIESPLREKMDTVWVTASSEANQLTRLSSKRGMSVADARQRMANQSSQADKIVASDTVIFNNKDFEDTWLQVQAAWQELFPEGSSGDTIRIPAISIPAVPPADLSTAHLVADRARPRQADQIAEFINRVSGRSKKLTHMDIMAAFGEKAFMLLVAEGQLVGTAGWQIENLVARMDELWLEKGLNLGNALTVLVSAIEEAANTLQAEACLLFIKPEMAAHNEIWQAMEYKKRNADELQISAWQEAALESQPPGTLMFFKQLRVDRVLRPI